MLKKILAIVTLMYAAIAFAAVDVNKASSADLDGIKGIGPSVSGRILDARKKGEFKDWGDLIERVKGVGEKNAAKFSEAGLTVGGAPFKAGATPKEIRKEPRASAKTSKDTKADAGKAETMSAKK